MPVARHTSATELTLRHCVALTHAESAEELTALVQQATAEIMERAERDHDPALPGLLRMLAEQVSHCQHKLETIRRLREQASSDPLTGLRHGRPFGRRLAAAVPERTALLAIDIDQFKEINDTLGHAAGDRVLVEVSRALLEALRQGDDLFRVGGDEFVAVIEVPTADVAMAVAGRLVTAARHTGKTISVGVAWQRRDESPEEALLRADRALYDVKRSGRNNVQLAD